MDWEEELDGFKYDSDKYEKKRIKVLQQEREAIQTKTFRKWINSILIKVNYFQYSIYVYISITGSIAILRLMKKFMIFSLIYRMEESY